MTLIRWYCHTCGVTHEHDAAHRDLHRDEIRAAEAAAIEAASPSATTPDEPASRPADAKGQGNAT